MMQIVLKGQYESTPHEPSLEHALHLMRPYAVA